mmetsp:Transcript_21490/g.31653  ORF Transcript_21490/g.31653 Transcript_21490/m.31653 type:complete len:224 (+) Transcript_21490:90-761(+)
MTSSIFLSLRSSLWLLVFCLHSEAVAGEQQLSTTLTSCTGDIDSFTVNSVTASCEDKCSWGNPIELDGNFTVGEYGISTDYPHIYATMFGMTIYDEEAYLCDGNEQSDDDGSSCSGTIQYLVDTEMPWYFFWGRWRAITVTTTFDFNSTESVTCVLEVESGTKDSIANSSNGNSNFVPICGSFALLIGAGIAILVKRKRRIATEDGKKKLLPSKDTESARSLL